jgi:hypothetical protein
MRARRRASGSSRPKAGSPSSTLPADQRRRYEVDLVRITRAAQAERAAAANFRIHDHDEESALAADARAIDAEQEAAAIRTVLARFPRQPSFPTPRSFR